MVIIGGGRDKGLGNKTLRAMFEDRKSIFVDLLKWNVPILEGRFELDEFDDEHAIYLIVADEDGDHLGSARLLPTVRRHILGALFPQLCSAPPPTGEHIFEITRFCLSRRQGAASRRITRNRLVSALATYALEAGIHTYTGVAHVAWFQQILAFGWDCQPLGAPAGTGAAAIGALAIHINGQTPALLAQNGIWEPGGHAPAQIAEAA